MSTEAKSSTPVPATEETSWQKFTSNLRTIGGAVVLAFFIRIVLFEAFEIDGPSMEPTLQHGDRVVVAKMLYGLFLPWANEAVLSWGAPDIGDVVIVKSPADEVDIVKRVVGVPGDVMELRAGLLYRNGEPVPHVEIGPCELNEQKEESPDCKVYEETLEGMRYHVSQGDVYDDDMRPVTVPAGHVFVRGDHRDRSNDSTNPMIGPVPVARIKGKALFIYLSCHDEGGGFLCDTWRWSRFFAPVQ